MRIPILIGPLEFQSKAEAKQYARSILGQYLDHQTITEQDDSFLRDLIAIHPEAVAKVGCGISHFSSQTDPIWKTTRHFVLVRTDGSTTDFSFHTCLDGSNNRKDVLHALRHAIAYQVLYFQGEEFRNGCVVCPYTKQLLTPSNCHVDHCPPLTF